MIIKWSIVKYIQQYLESKILKPLLWNNLHGLFLTFDKHLRSNFLMFRNFSEERNVSVCRWFAAGDCLSALIEIFLEYPVFVGTRGLQPTKSLFISSFVFSSTINDSRLGFSQGPKHSPNLSMILLLAEPLQGLPTLQMYLLLMYLVFSKINLLVKEN